MGLFDVDEQKLQVMYHRAWIEANRGFVDSRKYLYLDDAIQVYVSQHGCSYDEALLIAKNGISSL